MRCAAELCHHWTGEGCACEVFDLAPAVVCERCTGTRDADGTCPNCEIHRPQRQSTGSDYDPTRISDRARAAIEADEENP